MQPMYWDKATVIATMVKDSIYSFAVIEKVYKVYWFIKIEISQFILRPYLQHFQAAILAMQNFYFNEKKKKKFCLFIFIKNLKKHLCIVLKAYNPLL